MNYTRQILRTTIPDNVIANAGEIAVISPFRMALMDSFFEGADTSSSRL